MSIRHYILSKKYHMGRKSAYKEEYNQLAENYALLGATDKEMADLFSVTERTLNQWKKDYPEFLQSLKKRKEYCGCQCGIPSL